MLVKKMPIIVKKIFLPLFFFFNFSLLQANPANFNLWLDNFKIKAKNEGISQKTIEDALSDVQYISKLID